MKNKVILASAFMLCALSLVSAEMRKTPRGEPQALASADYGGVNYATASFTTAFTTVAIPTVGDSVQGVVYGVLFSTGSTADFVDVYDATTTVNATAAGPVYRLYNVNTSSGGIGAFAAGFSGPTRPIRFNRGLIFKASSALYNYTTLLFYSEPN